MVQQDVYTMAVNYFEYDSTACKLDISVNVDGKACKFDVLMGM